MAIYEGDLEITGSVGNLSFIKEKGTGRIFVRTKGGPSKKKIQKDPAFEVVRKNNKEFGGCSMAGKTVRIALGALEGLTNHNFSGYLNARVKNIMQFDTTHPLGQRAIYFSKYGKALNGFYLNRNNPLDTVVQTPVNFTLSRNEGKAIVDLPAVNPKLHLVNDYKYPFFRFAVSLGVVSDMEFSGKHDQYRPLNQGKNTRAYLQTEWHSVLRACTGQTLEIAIGKNIVVSENEALILAVGIEFGNPDTGGTVQPKKYSGSAKILAVF